MWWGVRKALRSRSASYEAVNWKDDHFKLADLEHLVSLVWGCELKDIWEFLNVGILGSASYEAVNWKRTSARTSGYEIGSASYEAVNWKICSFLLSLIVLWSASYEAVNWKKKGDVVATVTTGQPRMRLWIERILPSSYPYPDFGQPRMRLWIEILWPESRLLSVMVSLVWGCEMERL